MGVSPAGTAHKGSQQKPILTMQLPKEVGTEGPAAKVINKRPAREGGLCPLLCARGRGPASPLPRVPAGGCGIRHTGRGMVGSGAPGPGQAGLGLDGPQPGPAREANTPPCAKSWAWGASASNSNFKLQFRPRQRPCVTPVTNSFKPFSTKPAYFGNLLLSPPTNDPSSWKLCPRVEQLQTSGAGGEQGGGGGVQ